MNKTIVIFFLLLLFAKGFSQKETSKSKLFEDYRLLPSIGLSYQKQVVGEVGVFFAKYEYGGMCNPSILYGYKFASEFNFDNKNFYIAPKLAFEADLFFISARFNLIDYTNITYHDLKFTPEIGLTFLGIANLHYGYNIPLTANRINDVGTHRITLTYNFGILKQIN